MLCSRLPWAAERNLTACLHYGSRRSANTEFSNSAWRQQKRELCFFFTKAAEGARTRNLTAAEREAQEMGGAARAPEVHRTSDLQRPLQRAKAQGGGMGSASWTPAAAWSVIPSSWPNRVWVSCFTVAQRGIRNGGSYPTNIAFVEGKVITPQVPRGKRGRQTACRHYWLSSRGQGSPATFPPSPRGP